MSINKILGNPEKFLDEVFRNLKKSGIDVSDFELDHICYRVESEEKYFELKKKLLKVGELLIENLISGRQISTFKLNKPIIYENRKIFLIELPSPKKGSDYANGYEHIEFVISESFNEFRGKYNNIEFSEKAINKNINPDIKISYNNSSVKFHHNSLDDVIDFEKNNSKICPCGSGEKYKICCGEYHFGENPENALILMKSRYSAYAVNNANYIMKTTHSNNIEFSLDKKTWKKEIGNFSKNTKFLNLKIIDSILGENESFVTFKANLDSGEMIEKSRFLKENGIWLYESGEFI